MSCPAICAYGPSWPYPVRRPYTRRGLRGHAVVGSDAEALGDAGPEHVDHRVGVLREAHEDRGALGRLEVEADGALAAVHLVARGATVVRRARDLGAFDAQHVGAEVGEQHPAERSRPEPGDLEDARARERARHLTARSRVEGGRIEAALGDRHEDAVTLGDELAVGRRVAGDEASCALPTPSIQPS